MAFEAAQYEYKAPFGKSNISCPPNLPFFFLASLHSTTPASSYAILPMGRGFARHYNERCRHEFSAAHGRSQSSNYRRKSCLQL